MPDFSHLPGVEQGLLSLYALVVEQQEMLQTHLESICALIGTLQDTMPGFTESLQVHLDNPQYGVLSAGGLQAGRDRLQMMQQALATIRREFGAE